MKVPCSKYNPTPNATKLHLCAECMHGWGKGKGLEDYLQKDVLPQLPVSKQLAYCYRGRV